MGKTKVMTLKGVDWGAELNNFSLQQISSQEMLEVGRLVLNELVVVIRGQELAPRVQVDLARSIGDVEMMPESIWHRCPSDDNGIISAVQRVTGQKDEKGNATGLFGHDEDLDWHANRASAYRDRKDIVWLYGVHGTGGTRTSWLNTYRAYQELSEAWKQELKGKKGIFGYEANRYSSFNEFKSHREPQGIPLVYTNPLTQRQGLYFPFLQLFGIEGMSDIEFQSFVEELKREVLQEKYMYHHNWQDGDVVISDQWLTIHKRYHCQMEKRLLYRITMDYKNISPYQQIDSSIPLSSS